MVEIQVLKRISNGIKIDVSAYTITHTHSQFKNEKSNIRIPHNGP